MSLGPPVRALLGSFSKTYLVSSQSEYRVSRTLMTKLPAATTKLKATPLLDRACCYAAGATCPLKDRMVSRQRGVSGSTVMKSLKGQRTRPTRGLGSNGTESALKHCACLTSPCCVLGFRESHRFVGLLQTLTPRQSNA